MAFPYMCTHDIQYNVKHITLRYSISLEEQFHFDVIRMEKGLHRRDNWKFVTVQAVR